MTRELLAGVARTRITPWWGVELTGFGYYIERIWTRIRDHLHATAVVFDDGRTQACWIAVDLMVIDQSFSKRVREEFKRATGAPGDHVMIGCSHSHNAPAAGGLLGVGACDPDYEKAAAHKAATAAILAWRDRRPVRLKSASRTLDGLLVNRTRADGPVENHLTVLAADDLTTNAPLFVVVNYQGHPTVQIVRGMADVSRDWPGEVVDWIEEKFPTATGVFFMGSSGDLNMRPEFEAADRCHEPGRKVADAVFDLLAEARVLGSNLTIAVDRRSAILPTRRYERAAVEREQAEGRRRLATGDVSNWRETIGRVMVNRPDLLIESRYGGDEQKGVRALARFSVEWTERVLPELDSRPEHLAAEVQGFRVGDFFLAAQPSELFSEFSLSLREQFAAQNLMVVGYANERIGYVPDAPDIAKQSYAASQSPKYCLQFPFTEQSGPALVRGMLDALRATKNDR